MSLFKDQPCFCIVCGKQEERDPTRNVCSTECYREWEWRRALYVMGKDYYPKPV